MEARAGDFRLAPHLRNDNFSFSVKRCARWPARRDKANDCRRFGAAALGRSLTGSQRDAIAHVFASGGTLELIVGLAGSGKTTTLDILRAGYQDEGYRVLGTAISGQAARTLHDEAGVDSRTIASLVWRLEHGQVAIDHRTVLVVDEAGMADDQALLKLLAAVDLAGAKAIISR